MHSLPSDKVVPLDSPLEELDVEFVGNSQQGLLSARLSLIANYVV